MGTIECSQPASKSSWDSQDVGDISMVLKMAHFCKSIGPRWIKMGKLKTNSPIYSVKIFEGINLITNTHSTAYISQESMFKAVI